MQQLYYSKGPKFNGLTFKIYTLNDDKFAQEFIVDKLIAYFINDIEIYYYKDNSFKLEIYCKDDLIKTYIESSNDFSFSKIRDLINEYIDKNI